MNELERCRPWIEAALAHSGGTHDFDDVARGIIEGRMQLWPAPRGCAVTEIVVYPKKTVLNVFLAGGELDQILDGIESVAAWGRAQGCEGLSLAGRRGWERVLKSRGWVTTHAVMERSII